MESAFPNLLATSIDYVTYAALGMMLFMAVAFAVMNLILTHLLGPARQGKTKGMTYESGMNPVGTARKRFNVRFFVVAMTFLVFDVEIVFLYPWATLMPSLELYSGLSMQFLFRMFFFTFTTIIAFAYAWKKGVFRYD